MTGRLLVVFLGLAMAACSAGTTASTQTASELGLAPLVIGNTQLVGELPEPPSASDGDTQRIAANDVLDVTFYGVDDLNRTVQVDAQGRIALPLVGAIEAEGASRRELELTIAEAYARNYLQSPQVSVFVKEAVGQRVTVDGEVNRAGLYPVTAGTTLLQAITQAGNFSAVANPAQVLVFRRIGDGRYVASYDMTAIRRGRAEDPRIHGGDVVVVPNSARRIAQRNLRDMLAAAGSVAPLAVLGL